MIFGSRDRSTARSLLAGLQGFPRSPSAVAVISGEASNGAQNDGFCVAYPRRTTQIPMNASTLRRRVELRSCNIGGMFSRLSRIIILSSGTRVLVSFIKNWLEMVQGNVSAMVPTRES